LTLEETPRFRPQHQVPESRNADKVGEALSLADLHGMEVVGSVPIWALAGLRVHKAGWRQMQSGWVVGVYEMDISSLPSIEDPETPAAKAP
jgi:hypothetical protein